MYVIHLKPILLHQHTPSHPPFEKKYFAMIYLGTFLFIYRTQYITINKHRCDGNRKEENCMIEPLIQDFLETTEMCRIFLPYIHTHTHTHTGHFIMNTLPVPGWTPFFLQNCLNSLWHRFNKVLETFLWDFGPYWHDRITQLPHICRLHIYDANLPFHHIPMVLYWIEIWWLWRPFE